MMNIKPSDIDDISTVGELNGEDVKIIKTTGGFHVAVGKRTAASKETSILGGGSHKGLVVHHIQKDYPEFQQNIFKSENDSLPSIEEKTELLSDLTKKQNINLYMAKSENGNDMFVFAKYGVTYATYEIVDNKIVNTFFNKNAKK